jgi:hypothetical protein
MKKPSKTVKFNKFYPEDNGFINVSGSFTEKDDWQVNLTIQADTKNVVDFWVSDWNHKDAIAQLKEAAQKTIDFVQTCLAQPAKAAAVNAAKRAKKK